MPNQIGDIITIEYVANGEETTKYNIGLMIIFIIFIYIVIPIIGLIICIVLTLVICKKIKRNR